MMLVDLVIVHYILPCPWSHEVYAFWGRVGSQGTFPRSPTAH